MNTVKKSKMVMVNGPLDGLEIVWPEDAGDFPGCVSFGFYKASGDKIGDPQELIHHQYSLLRGWTNGPLDEENGVRVIHEVQEYIHGNCTKESAPSVSDMWGKA